MPVTKKAKRALSAEEEAPIQGRTAKRRLDRNDEVVNWRKLKVTSPLICNWLTFVTGACCGANFVPIRGTLCAAAWRWALRG